MLRVHYQNRAKLHIPNHTEGQLVGFFDAVGCRPQPLDLMP